MMGIKGFWNEFMLLIILEFFWFVGVYLNDIVVGRCVF